MLINRKSERLPNGSISDTGGIRCGDNRDSGIVREKMIDQLLIRCRMNNPKAENLGVVALILLEREEESDKTIEAVAKAAEAYITSLL